LIPKREHATNNLQTYFVTSKTWEGRALFQSDPWARLFFQVLLPHRGEAYFLHEFVLMPDHFHLLLSPLTALEKAVQLIKGGFSFRAKKDLGSNAEIWQRGFSDHRIRDWEDYQYSSVYPGWKLDPIPQGLKPTGFEGNASGTAEAVPFQNIGVMSFTKAESTGDGKEKHATQK
jgi:putative transposase